MERAAEAAREGDLHFFRGMSPDDLRRMCCKKDEDGRTLLHSAVTSGSLGLVQFLIDHGSTVETADEEVGVFPDPFSDSQKYVFKSIIP
jgi:26S proteasome non-ATPase regulatory subunit 10